MTDQHVTEWLAYLDKKITDLDNRFEAIEETLNDLEVLLRKRRVQTEE